MESPVVCYSTGTMNSVLDRLTKLKNHSNPADELSMLTDHLKQDLLGLKEDFCDKVAGRLATHKQIKVCMKQVRELVFNIEDWIDKDPEADLVADPRQKFDYFKAKIHGARERFKRYFNLHKLVPTVTDAAAAPTKIAINPQLLVEERSCRGLLDGPRDELVKYLTAEKDDMRKVVSVIGKEGLGKTTLAKEIYSELQLRRQFECQAFVSFGRRSAMTEILNNILRQVKPWSSICHDVQEVITELKEFLHMKRYFILVDGIQSTWAWKVINCALPNNRGSRVLTTTCIVDVGRSCSGYPNDLVYQIEALNKENSRILFLGKIITLQEEEKWADFDQDTYYMLKMCGGMPLAIIVAAGLLLARKSEALAELEMVGEPIYSLKQYSTSEWMTKMLHISFADLSLPLRSCFLYLSIFPENCTIRKDRLIQLWGAEGFIRRIDKECLWVTGERYFNELISRRLIQPVFDCEDDKAVGCSVHSVILDFLRSLSMEENFSTSAAQFTTGSIPCDTIRRFSLDCSNEDESGTLSISSMHLSVMRSLIVLGDVKGMFHPSASSVPEKYALQAIRIPTVNFSAFKVLRVLDLEDTRNLKDRHLQGIGGLVLLRYLGLAGTGIRMLPEDIGDLEQLDTLDLRLNGQVRQMPASVVKLQKVTHLLLQVDIMEIWEMPELERASEICIRNSSSLHNAVELLRKSERLRMLGISLGTFIPRETDLVPFLDQIVKSKLQSLSFYYDCDYKVIAMLVNAWEKVTAPLEKKFEPQRFELRLSLSLAEPVPPNMCSLACLTHLHVNCSFLMEAQDFLSLGGLTNLVLLNLMISFDWPVRRSFIINKGIFPSLKVFSTNMSFSWMELEFKEGAMPQLQRLWCSFPASIRGGQQYLDIGIKHLTCLTRVHAIINCRYATVSQVEAAEAAIRSQVSKNISKPTLELNREYETLMRKHEQGQELIPWQFRRQLSEDTSIRQEDDDQIQEDEGQHSTGNPSRWRFSEKADKSTLESSIKHEDQMWKDAKGKYPIPSRIQAFPNVLIHKLHRVISSMISDKTVSHPSTGPSTNPATGPSPRRKSTRRGFGYRSG